MQADDDGIDDERGGPEEENNSKYKCQNKNENAFRAIIRKNASDVSS